MKKIKLSRKMKITLVSLTLGIVLILLGVVSRIMGEVGVMGNLIIFATFVIITPQFFFYWERYRSLKEKEEKFPTFLRDVAEGIRSGLPLHKAIQACRRIDYGKLSEDVRKMANQLSWGMTLDKVLDQFSKRVRRSHRLYTSIQAIREASISGGDIASTLETMADNLTLLEDVEKERKTLINQYVVIIYAISLLFVGIVAAIMKLMVPIFKASAPGFGVVGMENPCGTCSGFSCDVCGIYQAIALIFTSDVHSVGAYYIAIFFLMDMIQAFFSGLMAGVMSEGSVIAGLRHSLILCFLTFGIFAIMVRIGVVGV